MRWLDASLLVAAIAVAGVANGEPIQYSTENLDSFGTLDIPRAAIRTQPDAFVVHRNGAQISIDVEASTPHSDERDVDCQSGQLSYKLDRPNVFAYSCRVGGDIVYTVSKYGKTYRVGASDATEEIGYTLRYPASQKKFWDAVVVHMSRSLHFAR